MSLLVSSSAFAPGGAIPTRYTGDGADVSPPLTWNELPAGTASLVLLCEDPDAPRGLWVHWVLFNLRSELGGLDEAVPDRPTLANGAVQGTNDFGKIGYGGPAPPRGKPHRYYFRLYALDKQLTLPPGATRQQVLAGMQGHILAEAALMGTYQR